MDLIVYFVFGSLIVLVLSLAFSWVALVISFIVTVIGFPFAVIAGMVSGLKSQRTAKATPTTSKVESEISALRKFGKKNSQQAV